MNRPGRWIAAALAGAAVWWGAMSGPRSPGSAGPRAGCLTAVGGGAGSALAWGTDGVGFVEVGPFLPGSAWNRLSPPPAPYSTGSLAEREGPEGSGGDESRSAGDDSAVHTLTPTLTGTLPATAASPWVAARSAAARGGLLSSGTRAPPSRVG